MITVVLCIVVVIAVFIESCIALRCGFCYHVSNFNYHVVIKLKLYENIKNLKLEGKLRNQFHSAES